MASRRKEPQTRVLSMAWYKKYLGKIVTINGCGGINYQGRLIACLNGRILLKDVYICKDNKRTQIPFLALEPRQMCCLYIREEGETVAIKPKNFR